MIELSKNKALIFFDGVCNLCNSSVQFVIKKDHNNHFLFAPLQSTIAQELISKYNIDITKSDSILLYIPEKGLYEKSTAVLKIASKLKFPWSILSIFLLVPKSIRNWVYDYIAKNRYRWFGKKEACMIPTKELKAKFLE